MFLNCILLKDKVEGIQPKAVGNSVLHCQRPKGVGLKPGLSKGLGAAALDMVKALLGHGVSSQLRAGMQVRVCSE